MPARLTLPDPSRDPLVTYGVNSSGDWSESELLRHLTGAKDRSRLLWFLWHESTSKAVRACRKCGIKDAGLPTVRVGHKGLGLGGLQRCGKVWLCPECSAVIWAERGMEIAVVAASHIAAGGSIAFATFTLPHQAPDRLDWLLGHMRKGWAAVMNGRGGEALREQLQLTGYVRVLEINVGQNGWHPHFHVALFLPPGVGFAAAVDEFGYASTRWRKAIAKAGGREPSMRRQHIALFGQGDYKDLAKYLSEQFIGGAKDADLRGKAAAGIGQKLGREFTQAAGKVARKTYGTRPAWALLRDAFDDGDADSLDLWKQYEQQTHRARGIVWSQELRKRYEMPDERSDEEIANDNRGGVDVMRLTVQGFTALLREHQLLPEMKHAWRSGGIAQLREFMSTNGIGFEDLEHEPTISASLP